MQVAHIAPHYSRYGKRGYDVFAVGLTTFFANTMKEAKKWCKAHGLSYIRI